MPGDKRRKEVQKRECIRTKKVYSKKLNRKVRRCTKWKTTLVNGN